MEVIVTRYHNATSTMGSRISATCSEGRAYVTAASASEESHRYAAETLAVQLGWGDEGWQSDGVVRGVCAWERATSDD